MLLGERKTKLKLNFSGCHTRHDGAIVTDIASERHLGSEKINGNEDSFVTDLLKNHLPTSIITCVIQEVRNS